MEQNDRTLAEKIKRGRRSVCRFRFGRGLRRRVGHEGEKRRGRGDRHQRKGERFLQQPTGGRFRGDGEIETGTAMIRIDLRRRSGRRVIMVRRRAAEPGGGLFKGGMTVFAEAPDVPLHPGRSGQKEQEKGEARHPGALTQKSHENETTRLCG